MAQPPVSNRSQEQRVAEFVKAHEALRAEVGKIIVGHNEVVGQVLVGLFAGGHVLLEGVPGLGKTLLIKTLAESLELSFSRIQFTPDLMPGDIIGTNIIVEDAQARKHFQFQRGPIFGHILLADEVNRATPKTQSALLEGMQEGAVTVSGSAHPLPSPFFVLATQNPIELEGTYPLPEAQLDRFMFNVLVDYPGQEEEERIVATTTSAYEAKLERVLGAADILELQRLIRRVPVADHVVRYAVRLARATRGREGAPEFVKQWVSWGAGPRASQFLVLGAKTRAVLLGRYAPGIEDVRAVAPSVLRHRIVTNFTAEAEGVKPERIIGDLLESVPSE